MISGPLIEKKFAYYGEKLDQANIEANIRHMQGNWKQDLGRLVKDLPEFQQVAQQVKEKLRLR